LIIILKGNLKGAAALGKDSSKGEERGAYEHIKPYLRFNVKKNLL
jgi:hypothetical protein